MPAAPKNHPKFRHHKASGQGFVVLDGTTFYLGRHDSPEALQRYHQKIAEWLAAGRQLPVDPAALTIKELIARYWVYADDYYRTPGGRPSSQIHVLRSSLTPLKELYSGTKVTAFKPLALKAVREQMIAKGWSRTTINGAISRIKQMFRWGVENELVSGEVFHALQAVTGLRRGRCNIQEREPVRPVPDAYINALEPYVSDQVWAMICLQRLTAARAGEVVIMRGCELDTDGRVWIYTPAEHKTAHHGHGRSIYIGPRAQKILKPFLTRPDAYLFSPAEAEAKRRAKLHSQRVTPMSCGNVPGSNCRIRPEREPGDHYTVAAYRRAIARACDEAFPPPEPLGRQKGETIEAWNSRLTAAQKRELHAWRTAHRWHPHQLRHNAATELRKEFGLEAARIILGHHSPAVTELYAERDRSAAIDVMLQVG